MWIARLLNADDDDDEQAVLSSLAPMLSNWQKETSDPWLCSPHAGPLHHHFHHHMKNISK